MKKILLTLVVLLTTALSANAFGDFRLGVTGGYNLTSASFDNSTVKHTLEGKNGSGWFIGPKAYMSLFAGLGVEGAMLYNQREYKMLSGKVVTEKLQSVDVPLNLKLNLTVQKVGVYLATGPQFSYGLGKNEIDVSSLIEKKGIYQTNNLTTTWNVGAGLALGGHFDLGIGYNVALNDMSKKVLKAGHVETGQTALPAYRLNTFNVQATIYF